MWVITYNGKPATLETICKAEGRIDITNRMEENHRNKIIAYNTRKKAISLYLYYIGFTWKERTKGINIKKFW